MKSARKVEGGLQEDDQVCRCQDGEPLLYTSRRSSIWLVRTAFYSAKCFKIHWRRISVKSTAVLTCSTSAASIVPGKPTGTTR